MARKKLPGKKYDFHFVVGGESYASTFVEEADAIGRDYTEHFRRILQERYQPKPQPKENDHA